MVATKCRCLHQCPDGARSGVCHLQPGGGFCFAHAEVITIRNGSDLSYEVTRGCFPADVEGLLQCKGAQTEHWAPKNISCCHNEDFCNDNLFPTIDDGVIRGLSQNLRLAEASASSSSSALMSVFLTPATVFILSALLSFLIFIFIGLLFYRRHHSRLKLISDKDRLEGEAADEHCTEFEGENLTKVDSKKLSTSQRLMQMLSGSSSPMISRSGRRGLSNFWKRTTVSVEAVVANGGGIITSCTSSPSDSSLNSSSNVKYSHLQHSASNASSKSSTMTSNGTTSTALNSTISNDPSLPEPYRPAVRQLVQKTFSNDIVLFGEQLKALENSRFGAVVYHGNFKETDVAVKIYPPSQVAAWKKEIAIYQNVMRHENVLQCLGADVVNASKAAATLSDFDCSGFWLVTEYHQNGSLYEYLNTRKRGLGLLELVSLMRSLVSGLEYLHRETIGTLAGKVAIAHRDLQSRRSVLVRADGVSCCIADFSMAVTERDCQEVNRRKGKGGNKRKLEAVDCRRYLAPELLVSAIDDLGEEDHFPPVHLEAYKRADIYALGLVFWEMYNFLDFSDEQEQQQQPKYKLPFEEEFEKIEEIEEKVKDPTLEEMHRLVVLEKRRPPLKVLPNEVQWPVEMTAIRTLIAECWSEMPSARLTALNIKKKLMACERNLLNCQKEGEGGLN